MDHTDFTGEMKICVFLDNKTIITLFSVTTFPFEHDDKLSFLLWPPLRRGDSSISFSFAKFYNTFYIIL